MILEMEMLGVFAGGLLIGVLLGLCILIFYKILKGYIDIRHLISEPGTHDASLSRFQFLVFTFVIAIGLPYVIIVTKSFPDIPTSILVLLGISGSSYVASKGIQSIRDVSMNKNICDKPVSRINLCGSFTDETVEQSTDEIVEQCTDSKQKNSPLS